VVNLDGVAHLPFLAQPELCWHYLLRLLAQVRLLPPLLPPPRSKRAVADSFGRAAASYDTAADLQQRVATRLAANVTLPTGARLLDVGCGTGTHSERLAQRFEVIALDLAPGMLAHARALHDGPGGWLCGDAENLPLAGASVDGVFSSLAVQWCDNFAAVCAELKRVLRPGGRAWLATLGPQTLHELRAAWRQADPAGVHVNDFAEREQIEAGADAAGLTIARWEESLEELTYAELRSLTRELKALGAHNVNSGRPTGLTGRERLRRFAEAYEAKRNAAGLLPATYQVWYLELRKDE
jgi:malonyl-CoA O-methyltransferase